MLAEMIVIQTGWRKKRPVVFRISAGCARTRRRRVPRVFPLLPLFLSFFLPPICSFLSIAVLCISSPFHPFVAFPSFTLRLFHLPPSLFPCDRRLHSFFFPREICHQSEIIRSPLLRSMRYPRRNSPEKASARACSHVL